MKFVIKILEGSWSESNSGGVIRADARPRYVWWLDAKLKGHGFVTNPKQADKFSQAEAEKWARTFQTRADKQHAAAVKAKSKFAYSNLYRYEAVPV